VKTIRLPCFLVSLAAVVVLTGAADSSLAAEPVSAAAAAATGTGAGEAAQATQPPNTRDIIIGTVKRFSDAEGTNANPTPVLFEITETLKGELKGTIKVAWREPPPDWNYTSSIHYGTEGDAWANQKVVKPKVGDSYILFGETNGPIGIYSRRDGQEGLWFYAAPGGRRQSTAENRDKALQSIKFYEDEAKARAERTAAQAARAAAQHAEAVQRFRTPMPDEKLAAAVQSADFVALATFGGADSGMCGFQVTEILKGRKRLSPPPRATGPIAHDYPYYVRFEVPREMVAGLEKQTPCVVMLSEKGLTMSFTALQYQTIQAGRPFGDHVAFADETTVKRVRELTQGQAGKGPPAVLVHLGPSKFLDALDDAAGGKVAFVRTCVSSGLDSLDKAAVSRQVDVDWLLNIERRSASGKDSKPSYKFQLAKRGDPKTILMDMTLPEVDEKNLAAPAADAVAEILKVVR
jgi:hypothetical protein